MLERPNLGGVEFGPAMSTLWGDVRAWVEGLRRRIFSVSSGSETESFPASPRDQTQLDYSGAEIKKILSAETSNPKLFEHLVWLAIRQGINLKVADPQKKGKCYSLSSINNINESSKLVVVENVKEFATAIEALYALFSEKFLPHVTKEEAFFYGFELPRFDQFFNLFFDATPSDFMDFSQYLHRRASELSNGPVVPFGEAEGVLTGKIAIKGSVTPRDMEGYFQMEFTDLRGESPLALSEVRYGISGANEAVIYAVQNPKVNGFSYVDVQKKLESIENEKAWMKGCFGLAISGVGWPFLVDGEVDEAQLIGFFEADAEKAVEELMEYGVNLGDAYRVKDLVYSIKKKGDLLQNKLLLEKNMEAVKKINKAMRKGMPESAGSLRTVGGQSLISFLLAIKSLHESGVRRVKMPMKMPMRGHYAQEGIDERIFVSKLNLVRRLVYELEGVDASTEGVEYDPEQIECRRNGGSGADYLVINLEDKLSPKRQVIKDLWVS